MKTGEKKECDLMAQVVKENTTLQVDAKKEWTFLGIIWGVVLLTFFLPAIFEGTLGIFFVPIITLGVATKSTWKSLIIIRGNRGEKRVFGELKLLPPFSSISLRIMVCRDKVSPRKDIWKRKR